MDAHNELGAYFLEGATSRVASRCARTFLTKYLFKSTRRCARRIPSGHIEGVDLVVLEFGAVLWGTVRLHNTIDTAEIHETIGGGGAGRYDAWGFCAC